MTSSSAVRNEIWKCIDDGSGKGRLFISFPSGERTRAEPPGFQPEVFYSGEMKYYFKGTCIRCRDRFAPIVFSRNSFDDLFALNICERCILRNLESSSIRGNGDEVWEKFEKEPKNCLYPIRLKYLNINREIEIYERALEAKLYVNRGSKHRRNLDRAPACFKLTVTLEGMETLSLAGTGANLECKANYLSWGFSDIFDEYFGEIQGFEGSSMKLAKGVPNGKGVKYYSDGSTYIGEWILGVPFTDKNGVITRPDRSQYEGQWMNGKRHGQGKQTYPDGAVYIGQFADGYEHGSGKVLIV